MDSFRRTGIKWNSLIRLKGEYIGEQREDGEFGGWRSLKYDYGSVEESEDADNLEGINVVLLNGRVSRPMCIVCREFYNSNPLNRTSLKTNYDYKNPQKIVSQANSM